ncbi:MAG: hypothetical protein AMXMBFR13_32030 [Phycisphaerae bacterium]
MPVHANATIKVVKYNENSTYTPLATFGQNGQLSLTGDLSTSGNLNTTANLRVTGDAGIGIASPSYKLHVNGSVAGIGDYVNRSDERLKQNVQPIGDAVEQLSRLEGVSFDWRQDGYTELNLDSRRHLGLIAQEVEKVLPEAVSKDHESRYSVAYSAIVLVLVEAVKEQQARMDSLETENKRLKEKKEQLEARLAAIEFAVAEMAAKLKGGQP